MWNLGQKLKKGFSNALSLGEKLIDSGATLGRKLVNKAVDLRFNPVVDAGLTISGLDKQVDAGLRSANSLVGGLERVKNIKDQGKEFIKEVKSNPIEALNRRSGQKTQPESNYM